MDAMAAGGKETPNFCASGKDVNDCLGVTELFVSVTVR